MNWTQLLKALQDAGLTQTAIAEKCGCAQTTISDLARGATQEPKYSTGRMLLALAEINGIPVGYPVSQSG